MSSLGGFRTECVDQVNGGPAGVCPADHRDGSPRLDDKEEGDDVRNGIMVTGPDKWLHGGGASSGPPESRAAGNERSVRGSTPIPAPRRLSLPDPHSVDGPLFDSAAWGWPKPTAVWSWPELCNRTMANPACSGSGFQHEGNERIGRAAAPAGPNKPEAGTVKQV